MVLLENKGILPLDVSKKPKVAVIGPTADDQLAMFSGYSFPVHLIVANMQEERVQYAKTPLQALTERLGGGNVTYAKGCEILTERNPEAPVFPGDVDSEKRQLDRRSPVSRDTSQIEDAVACARQCDVAIVFVGDLAGLFQTGTVGEGSDTDSLQLPGVQEELLKQVIATGTPTISCNDLGPALLPERSRRAGGCRPDGLPAGAGRSRGNRRSADRSGKPERPPGRIDTEKCRRGALLL